jgi:DivIVA domain-containing protein
MALTPEDVVNKRFQSTKFREGYDQDEVDDFLDEIVVELRRLTQENDELRQRLVAADARMSMPMEAPAPAAAPAPMPFPVAEAPAMPGAEPGVDTNNLLQLARRLHEEHVREGLAKKDQIIAEGHAEAARIVAEATNSQQGQLQSLERERMTLQQRVDELRTFEREYRQQLRTYIQSQLTELEGTAQPAAAAPAATVGSAPAGGAQAYASAPSYPAEQAYPASAPGYPATAAPAQGYPAPQSPPPGQFPGYGS